MRAEGEQREAQRAEARRHNDTQRPNRHRATAHAITTNHNTSQHDNNTQRITSRSMRESWGCFESQSDGRGHSHKARGRKGWRRAAAVEWS